MLDRTAEVGTSTIARFGQRLKTTDVKVLRTLVSRHTNDVPSLTKDLERFLISGTDLASESSWGVNRGGQ